MVRASKKTADPENDITNDKGITAFLGKVFDKAKEIKTPRTEYGYAA